MSFQRSLNGSEIQKQLLVVVLPLQIRAQLVYLLPGPMLSKSEKFIFYNPLYFLTLGTHCQNSSVFLAMFPAPYLLTYTYLLHTYINPSLDFFPTLFFPLPHLFIHLLPDSAIHQSFSTYFLRAYYVLDHMPVTGHAAVSKMYVSVLMDTSGKSQRMEQKE